MISHDDYMKKLSEDDRQKVLSMAKELIAEEKTLRQIRRAREYSQVTLAELLGMNQGDLSKFERRTDAYLSTIRRYIEANYSLEAMTDGYESLYYRLAAEHENGGKLVGTEHAVSGFCASR